VTASDLADRYSPLCPECGDPYIGGPGCYAGACAAEPDDECSCASYDCAGECCGVGNCTCTPASGDPHPRGDGPAPVLAEGSVR
jgi:hypothetical protein